MNHLLTYQGQASPKVTIKIHPSSDFKAILSILDGIDFPGYLADPDNLKYALLELLNNSLRAHREKQVSQKIITTFSTNDATLEIKVQDWGGGFDPEKLPYDINQAPDQIDQTGPAFQEYQQKNDYKRFGMGLLLAKKTFSIFEIIFLDHSESPVDWEEGKVIGTLIRLVTGECNNGN